MISPEFICSVQISRLSNVLLIIDGFAAITLRRLRDVLGFNGNFIKSDKFKTNEQINHHIFDEIASIVI